MIKAATRPIRLIGYCRVSTDEQARNGESLSVQRSRILMYCQQGHVPIELVDIVEDAGLSGKKWDRPGFQRIIAMLKAGEVDGVVVSRLDRLSRTVRHVLKLVEEVFIPRDLHLLSVNEQVDTRTPMGQGHALHHGRSGAAGTRADCGTGPRGPAGQDRSRATRRGRTLRLRPGS